MNTPRRRVMVGLRVLLTRIPGQICRPSRFPCELQTSQRANTFSRLPRGEEGCYLAVVQLMLIILRGLQGEGMTRRGPQFFRSLPSCARAAAPSRPGLRRCEVQAGGGSRRWQNAHRCHQRDRKHPIPRPHPSPHLVLANGAPEPVSCPSRAADMRELQRPMPACRRQHACLCPRFTARTRVGCKRAATPRPFAPAVSTSSSAGAERDAAGGCSAKQAESKGVPVARSANLLLTTKICSAAGVQKRGHLSSAGNSFRHLVRFCIAPLGRCQLRKCG